MAQLQQTADAFPYWQYLAVVDSRTRDNHRALHQRIFKVTEVDFYPPIGFNCRCTARPLTKRQADRHREQHTSPQQIKALKTNLNNTTLVGNKNELFLRWADEKFRKMNPQNLQQIHRGFSGNLYSSLIPPSLIKSLERYFEKLIKKQRKISHEKIKRWAKTNIVGKAFKTPDGKTIVLSNRDVKDILNQPHKKYIAKNKLLYNLDAVLENSVLVKNAPERKGRARYKHWYYYKYKKEFYLNVVETYDNSFMIHAITDYIK